MSVVSGGGAGCTLKVDLAEEECRVMLLDAAGKTADEETADAGLLQQEAQIV